MGPTLTLDESGGQYAWFTGESQEGESRRGRPAPGVYLVALKAGAGAVGVKRALNDSLEQLTRPMLAGLERATLIGALGMTRGANARHVLALRTLSADGALSPWLQLGSGVKSAAIAGHGARNAWAAWAETTDGGTRVRVARLAVLAAR